MFSFTLFASTLSILSVAYAAPAVDSAALEANGLAAQTQNAAFQNLTVNDTCTTGEIACIAGALAQCGNNAWSTTDCPDASQCFSIPSIRSNGTLLQCTSEKDALSIIDATGVSGGIFGNGTESNNDKGSGSNGGGKWRRQWRRDECRVHRGDFSHRNQRSQRDYRPVTLTPSDFHSRQYHRLTLATTTLSPEEASSLLATATLATSAVPVSASVHRRRICQRVGDGTVSACWRKTVPVYR
ncbi:hypothetical protein BDZ89DRAFT_1030534 [Hymenopellis radicata]|nr:hypothetical protein BDZ89DRAFT_1030534 [Hymenopellis radicata]